jgi:hypothetical protein
MFSGETFGLEVPGWRATVFIFAVGLFILFLIGVYIADVTQTKHAIRRNYPVIGHFRYYFEHIGTFFRQYFFTMDREVMPFKRALLRGYSIRDSSADDTHVSCRRMAPPLYSPISTRIRCPSLINLD